MVNEFLLEFKKILDKNFFFKNLKNVFFKNKIFKYKNINIIFLVVF